MRPTLPESEREREIDNDKFDRAIRTFRIWPIEEADKGAMSNEFDSFLRSALVMTEEDMQTLIIDDISRARTAPRSRQHKEVTVLFREKELRELVLSYARNLSKY